MALTFAMSSRGFTAPHLNHSIVQLKMSLLDNNVVFKQLFKLAKNLCAPKVGSLNESLW
jgi:hypothetical protein